MPSIPSTRRSFGLGGPIIAIIIIAAIIFGVWWLNDSGKLDGLKKALSSATENSPQTQTQPGNVDTIQFGDGTTNVLVVIDSAVRELEARIEALEGKTDEMSDLERQKLSEAKAMLTEVWQDLKKRVIPRLDVRLNLQSAAARLNAIRLSASATRLEAMTTELMNRLRTDMNFRPENFNPLGTP